MQFKLGKCSLKISYFKLVLFFWFSNFAYASVTVTPVSPYIKSNSTIHYPTGSSSGGSTITGATVDDGFHIFDLTQDYSSDSSTRSDILLFDVTSSTTFSPTGDQKIVITVTGTFTISGTSTEKVLPIIVAGTPSGTSAPSDCVDGSTCQGTVTGNSGTDYRSSAIYTNGSTIRIGLYPKDMCDAANASSEGCTNSTTPTIPTTTATTFSLKFYVSLAADSSSTGDVTSSSESESISITFNNQPATYSCPSSTISEIYFPGDNEILVNTESISKTVNSGGAPMDSLLVFAEKTDNGSLDTNTFYNNSIASRVSFTGTQTIGGFENTDSTASTNSYYLGFNVRDQAGIIPSFVSSCEFDGVKTAEILGFIQKNQCFIASAVFGSENPGLKLIRNFRDIFLLKSSWGKVLVDVYYKYSPDMSVWLVEHLAFRYPVLSILLPIQILMWFVLNPMTYLVSVLSYFFFLFFIRRKIFFKREQAQ